MNKKIIFSAVAVLVVVILVVAFLYTYTPYLGPDRTLDFTITGSYPEVLYVPMVAKYWELFDKAEQWNLTIRVEEFSSESEPVAVMIYRHYWNEGEGYKCNISEVPEDAYNEIAYYFTHEHAISEEGDWYMQIIAAEGFAARGGEAYSTEWTIFVPFPEGGGTYHIKMKKTEWSEI